jgi:hypothetical protein
MSSGSRLKIQERRSMEEMNKGFYKDDVESAVCLSIRFIL